MTRIEIAGGAGRWRFAAAGHATGAPEACSGVSALLFALAGWLRGGPPGVGVETVFLAPGEAELAFSGGDAAAAAAELTAVGLAQIAKRYPQAVTVERAQGRLSAAPADGRQSPFMSS